MIEYARPRLRQDFVKFFEWVDSNSIQEHHIRILVFKYEHTFLKFKQHFDL